MTRFIDIQYWRVEEDHAMEFLQEETIRIDDILKVVCLPNDYASIWMIGKNVNTVDRIDTNEKYKKFIRRLKRASNN